MDETVIADIPKNRREVVRVSIVTREGRQFVQLRAWFNVDGETDLRPGQQSISFNRQLLSEIRAALEAADKIGR